MSDEDTGVHDLRRRKRYNSRVLSIYFKTIEELREIRRAAKKAKKKPSTFIRECALKCTKKVLAA